MHSLMAAMFTLALLMPSNATAANAERPLVLALNPQPEPPSLQQKQRSQRLIRSNRLRNKQMKQQDLRKLNPQPGPPRPTYPK